MDRYVQNGGRAGEPPTEETVEARLGRLLAIQEPLLNTCARYVDLVQWRDEVVRLEQRRDDGIRPLGDLAELLAGGDEGRFQLSVYVSDYQGTRPRTLADCHGRFTWRDIPSPHAGICLGVKESWHRRYEAQQ